MAFQTPLTINQIIKDIHSKKYLLPSIQREFVWSQEQIIFLFDSLMRSYPINAFLFWKIPREKSADFEFYEFIRDFHRKDNRHNPKANISGSNEVMAVLDGQQRLTSLYVALKGTYADKLPYKRWDNPDAYPTKRLYLNLLSQPGDEDLEYNFEFLTNNEAQRNDESHHWFLVGNILDLTEQNEVNDYLIENGLMSNPDREKGKLANRALFMLHKVIHVNPAISYYLEESDELDKVLNIFIRINSGGTVLSYSDLLLSIATAQWKRRSARDEINDFVDEANQIGQGFNINKDMVLKAALVLCDIDDIRFRVDNFNRNNMHKIEREWDSITKAIKDAMLLLSSFGFSRANITSNNLIVPIAYYLKSIGLPNNYANSTNAAVVEDRRRIKRWFVASLLKRVFSYNPDGVLKPVREIIKQHNTNSFPLNKIIDRFKGTNRTLYFTEDEITNLINTKYGQGNTLVILSMLYPSADLRNNFHIDHMFPKSKFTRSQLALEGVAEENINDFIMRCDLLGNLELLEGIPNQEKKAMNFDRWLSERIPSEELDDYKRKHFVPDVDLSFENFGNFFKKREEQLLRKLKEEL